MSQTGAGVHPDRPDEERGQRDHDQHREERHEDHLDVLGMSRLRGNLYSGPRTAAISSGGNTWEL